MMPLFQTSEEASASKWQGSLDVLHSSGQELLDTIQEQWQDSLLSLERRLSAMQTRRQRAYRLAVPGVAAKFLVSDFVDIEQSRTTATVRADAASIALRERDLPSEAVIRTIKFRSSNESTIEKMGSFYRVSSLSPPQGVFDIELFSAVRASLLVFDTLASPSDAGLQVEVSENGVTYSSAVSITQNGYRAIAYLEPQSVRFVRLTFIPTHPDTLGGTAYSFGLTDLHVLSVDFHLRADFLSRVITAAPQATQLRFQAADTVGLSYFLSINGGVFISVRPGDLIAVPTAEAVAVQVSLDGTGLLAHTLPGNIYLPTLKIKDATSGQELRLAPGASPAITGLTNQYVVIDGSDLHLRAYAGPDAGRLFDISYLKGPAQISVQLRVELVSSSRSVSPTFTGAQLEEV